ncbi:MAG: helix-turn-helix domain-containing protein [Deltaproteobacteria bacterium]|nr:helix-turn-helix domain-containing protein [Deltaproteobacteria bacterium]
MKVHHNKEVDYLSIDFTDEVEAKSEYKEGIIVRYDKKGHVIGIDITDSMKLFTSPALLTLREVCQFMGLSESTMRRRIKEGKVKYTKVGKDYRFKKVDILKLAGWK